MDTKLSENTCVELEQIFADLKNHIPIVGDHYYCNRKDGSALKQVLSSQRDIDAVIVNHDVYIPDLSTLLSVATLICPSLFLSKWPGVNEWIFMDPYLHRYIGETPEQAVAAYLIGMRKEEDE